MLEVEKEPGRYAKVRETGLRAGASGVRGLRGLFEAALGVGGGSEDRERKKEGGLGLGLSVETPALAGLLGREMRKGEIRAVGQDEIVDIEGIEEEEGEAGKEKSRGYGIWAPKRRGKKVVMDMIEGEVGDSGHLGASPAVEDRIAPALSLEGAQGSSRFHVKKRVTISDWSQSLRRGKKLFRNAEYTHSICCSANPSGRPNSQMDDSTDSSILRTCRSVCQSTN